MNQHWRGLVRDFRADRAFWYFPHATIDVTDVRPKLAVLAEFDGQAWDHDRAARRLRQERLSTGGAAAARMLRKAVENAGFCWLDDHILRVTPSGRALLGGDSPTALMERVLWRYELSTPINNPGPMRLFPHIALLEILLACGGQLTRDEFILLAGRTRTNDVREAIQNVRAWRQLSHEEREDVIGACGRAFGRRATDSGYTMNFHGCASYLERFSDDLGRRGIRLLEARRSEIRAKVRAQRAAMEWIDFASAADCIAAYGNIDAPPDLIEAVDYYLDTSQIEKAVDAFRRLPAVARQGRSVEEFEKEAFLEKHLEDYLAVNLGLIEQGLVLEGAGRQQQTTVGTMDLFARAPGGDLVVIELKKVRASDKVFGQICRYMGWVAQEYDGGGHVVRGYIVGSEIDPKLHYAASVVGAPTMRLKRFKRDPNDQNIWIEDALPD